MYKGCSEKLKLPLDLENGKKAHWDSQRCIPKAKQCIKKQKNPVKNSKKKKEY